MDMTLDFLGAGKAERTDQLAQPQTVAGKFDDLIVPVLAFPIDLVHVIRRVVGIVIAVFCPAEFLAAL